MTRRVVVSLSVVLVAGAVFVESRFSRARPAKVTTEVAAPGALMLAPPKVRTEAPDAGLQK